MENEKLETMKAIQIKSKQLFSQKELGEFATFAEQNDLLTDMCAWSSFYTYFFLCPPEKFNQELVDKIWNVWNTQKGLEVSVLRD